MGLGNVLFLFNPLPLFRIHNKQLDDQDFDHHLVEGGKRGRKMKL